MKRIKQKTVKTTAHISNKTLYFAILMKAKLTDVFETKRFWSVPIFTLCQSSRFTHVSNYTKCRHFRSTV